MQQFKILSMTTCKNKYIQDDECIRNYKKIEIVGRALPT